MEEVQNEYTEGLELDLDVLEKEDRVSTSLCDRFGIHMYTEEFLKKEGQYQQERKEEKEKIFQDVLHNQENLETEEAFQQVMQAESVEVIKSDYDLGQEQDTLLMPACYGLLGAILAGAFLFFIERKRRRQHENHHNHKK